MDDYLSNKPDNFVDDPEKLYRLRRCKIRELCTSDIIDLPILNLADIRRPFEIKTSTIRMVQHSPFTGNEDPNLHLQAFINYVKHSTWMG
jgi:hypothetical protein